jgi:hypothetical protein
MLDVVFCTARLTGTALHGVHQDTRASLSPLREGLAMKNAKYTRNLGLLPQHAQDQTQFVAIPIDTFGRMLPETMDALVALYFNTPNAQATNVIRCIVAEALAVVAIQIVNFVEHPADAWRTHCMQVSTISNSPHTPTPSAASPSTSRKRKRRRQRNSRGQGNNNAHPDTHARNKRQRRTHTDTAHAHSANQQHRDNRSNRSRIHHRPNHRTDNPPSRHHSRSNGRNRYRAPRNHNYQRSTPRATSFTNRSGQRTRGRR